VVLVIEDDADVADAVKDLLDDEGYAVLLATSSAEARQLIATNNPHAILIDVVLRDEENAEGLIAELHGRGRVVVTSATPSNRCVALKYGLPFIDKPFDRDEFVAILRRVASDPGAEPK
jgi:DNA-binding response OmpR family regulator